MRRVGAMACAAVAVVATAHLASAQIQPGMKTAAGTDTSMLTVEAGAGRLLVLAVAVRDASTKILGVTFGGQSLERFGDVPGSGGCLLSLWRLVAPDSGTYPITVRYSGAEKGLVVAVPYRGVDPSSPKASPSGADGVTRTASVTTPSAAGDLVVGVACARGDASGAFLGMLAGQSFRTGVRFSDLYLGISDKVGGPSVTLAWPVTGGAPSIAWTASAFSLQPAVPFAVPDAGTPDAAGQDLAAPDLAGDPPSEPAPPLSPDGGGEPVDAGDPADSLGVGSPPSAVDLRVVSACSLARGPGPRPAALTIVWLVVLLRRRRSS